MGTLVELCAGLAALTWHLFGQEPPVSRIGSKRGYAAAVVRAMGLAPPKRVLLVDRDPAVVEVLRALCDPRARAEVAARVEAVAHRPARPLWERLRAEAPGQGPAAAARWLLLAAGSFGGQGKAFKGLHKNHPNVDGFIPARSSLAARVRAFALPAGVDIEVRCADASAVVPVPGAAVYIDPPYRGRQGYGYDLGEPVEALATRWAAVCPLVAVSEGARLRLPGWQQLDLTHARQGQRRRSLTTSTRELLYLHEAEPPRTGLAALRAHVFARPLATPGRTVLLHRVEASLALV